MTAAAAACLVTRTPAGWTRWTHWTWPAYSGQSGTALLTAVADPPELPQRAAGLLREAGWLVRCEGTVDAERIGTLLRVGTVVTIEGAGTLHSGNWFVWSVRHVITQDAYRMRFTFVRNAMGPGAAWHRRGRRSPGM